MGHFYSDAVGQFYIGANTYAIHFQTWASAIDLKVDFYLYRFAGIGDRVVQVIEDGLWDHMKPMLGRRGEK